MIHTAELDLNQLGIDDATEKPIQLGVFNYWASHGYPVESILEAHTVVHSKDTSENTGHIVLKIETLERPLDVADLVEDKTEMWVCDCRDFQYNQSVDLSERWLTEWGICKHCLSVSREERAKADENQDTIV